ncbi:hypothetical protein BO70DRAFT_426639 [Aspergillus heteromorphus CBS 117.55]|uniref:NAD(P)-binding protein n=1 Tax=Aspergillus heteromorphus CBS 117.55 TaxID=1448321 RepID=A0A317WR08_9EURO|nr:uncharacterized protein BO70DRAFT_426639 [Aspergillus heteromorphus CBS 117.55]PWY88944.1 hypothetical protein BO70DRAFT_426639 [Aspergillus heteromorphus CBS 117.55]
MSIGIAIIGSGIFAREEHLPILLSQPNPNPTTESTQENASEREGEGGKQGKTHPFILKALYSRTLHSAQSLLASVPAADPDTTKRIEEIDVYADDAGVGRKYEDLCAREDALRAGKHVLSEKPIAGDLATAQEMVRVYKEEILPRGRDGQAIECAANGQREVANGETTNGNTNQDEDKKERKEKNKKEKKNKKNKVTPLWGVAENYRFLPKYLLVAEEVRKLGPVKGLRVCVRSLVGVGSKYHQTPWRRHPSHEGGFVLDGGVHIIAALRLILGPENPLTTVSAMSSLHQPHLHPVDTVDALVRTRSGAVGCISLSYGAAPGTNGTVFELRVEEALADLEVMVGMFASEREKGVVGLGLQVV